MYAVLCASEKGREGGAKKRCEKEKWERPRVTRLRVKGVDVKAREKRKIVGRKTCALSEDPRISA